MRRTKNIFHYQVRKCRRSEEKVKASKLLDSCLNGGKDLFKEIKKQRMTANKTVNNIDGKTENISERQVVY